MLPVAQLAGAAGAGLAGGVLSGFFGVGGNFILVPLLGLALRLTQQQAQGLTLAALLPPLGWPAVWQYRRAGVPLLWPIVGFTILGFLPTIPLGSLVANLLPAAVLRAGFAVLLALVAFRVWRSTKAQQEQPHLSRPPAGYVPKTVLSGAAAGFASGLLGIGGAIVLIPLLTRQLGLSQKQAQLTSLAMLLPPIAAPGVWVYAQQNEMPWGALLPVAIGFVVGAFLGAKVSQVVSPARLTRGFGVLMLISSVALIISAL
jgi:uncharacterized protein